MMICRFNGVGCDVGINKAMTQVKFTIKSDVVAGFKARCASKGVSMTSAVRQWMMSAHQLGLKEGNQYRALSVCLST